MSDKPSEKTNEWLITSALKYCLNFYKEVNPATLNGAIDTIAIVQPDGSIKSTPFHVRFGKIGVFRAKNNVVTIKVNNEKIEGVYMKLGERGEAFFVREVSEEEDRLTEFGEGRGENGSQDDLSNRKQLPSQRDERHQPRNDELVTSPIISPAESDEEDDESQEATRSTSLDPLSSTKTKSTHRSFSKETQNRKTSIDDSGPCSSPTENLLQTSENTALLRLQRQSLVNNIQKVIRQSKSTSEIDNESNIEWHYGKFPTEVSSSDLTSLDATATLGPRKSKDSGPSSSIKEETEQDVFSTEQTSPNNQVSSTSTTETSNNEPNFLMQGVNSGIPFEDLVNSDSNTIESYLGPTIDSPTSFNEDLQIQEIRQTSVSDILPLPHGHAHGRQPAQNITHTGRSPNLFGLDLDMSIYQREHEFDPIETQKWEAGKVTFEQFQKDPYEILNNEHLIVKYNNLHMPWRQAAPYLVSLSVFNQQLDTTFVDKTRLRNLSMTQEPGVGNNEVEREPQSGTLNESNANTNTNNVKSKSSNNFGFLSLFSRSPQQSQSDTTITNNVSVSNTTIHTTINVNINGQTQEPQTNSSQSSPKSHDHLAPNLANLSNPPQHKSEPNERSKASESISSPAILYKSKSVSECEISRQVELDLSYLSENAIREAVVINDQDGADLEVAKLMADKVTKSQGPSVQGQRKSSKSISVMEHTEVTEKEELDPEPEPSQPKKPDQRRPSQKFQKSMFLTPEQYMKLNLKPGRNEIIYSITSQYHGTTKIESAIYLYNYSDKLVVSDIDGTITRSDALGMLLPAVGAGTGWTHTGVATLYNRIRENDYKFVYLSSRAIGQMNMTKKYLDNVEQGEGVRLPHGPVLLSPSNLFGAFRREVITRNPEEFKIQSLQYVKDMFPKELLDNPFYAGFGNKINDCKAYETIGIEKHRIFIINKKGEVRPQNKELAGTFHTSYEDLGEVAEYHFPPIVQARVGRMRSINMKSINKFTKSSIKSAKQKSRRRASMKVKQEREKERISSNVSFYSTSEDLREMQNVQKSVNEVIESITGSFVTDTANAIATTESELSNITSNLNSTSKTNTTSLSDPFTDFQTPRLQSTSLPPLNEILQEKRRRDSSVNEGDDEGDEDGEDEAGEDGFIDNSNLIQAGSERFSSFSYWKSDLPEVPDL